MKPPNYAGTKTRGVLYMVWGGEREGEQVEKVLERSIDSVKRVHPELPIEIYRGGTKLTDKSTMFDVSPFEETLYLDADTVVMDRLDFGFTKTAEHGLACAICECPWARRFGGLKDRGDIIEYNTGVLFFDMSVKPVFDRWKAYSAMDSELKFFSGQTIYTMPENDQASFAKAVEDEKFNPFVLPMNWNFRPIWQRHIFGPLRIWHDYTDVPFDVWGWHIKQSAKGAIVDYAKVDR